MDGMSGDGHNALAANPRGVRNMLAEAMQRHAVDADPLTRGKRRIRDFILDSLTTQNSPAEWLAQQAFPDYQSTNTAGIYADSPDIEALAQAMAGPVRFVERPAGLGVRSSSTSAPRAHQTGHRPPDFDNGAPLSDLTGEGRIYPDDVYSPEGPRYYGTGDRALDAETFRLARATRGNPDAEVMAYRAMPLDVPSADIHPGDWVTPNLQYAITHGEGPLRGEYQIIGRKAKAKDLFTNGDSIHEFGYQPNEFDALAEYFRAEGPVRAPQFLYHVTPKMNALAIAREGLRPDAPKIAEGGPHGDTRGVFLGDEGTVPTYTDLYGAGGDPLSVFRVDRASVPGLVADTASEGAAYVTPHRIPPEALQVETPRGWMPVIRRRR